MSPVKSFHKYRGRKDFSIGSLIRAVRVILPDLVGRQIRYKVTDMPTERTIRYYISMGLVDQPSGRRGTAGLYGYRHLLQIVVVKYLQSQYLPLRKIRSVLKNRSNRELEQLIPYGKSSRAAAVAKRGESDSLPPETDVAGGLRLPRPSPGIGTGREDHRGVFPGEETWRRFVIASGLELHLREDRIPPHAEELKSWEKSLLGILRELWSDETGGTEGS